MATGSCDLCGLPVLGRPLRDGARDFCCEGCRRVYLAAEEAGLGTLVADARIRRTSGADAAVRKAAALAVSGARRETLRVSGMWCASCAGVLEDALLMLPGVLDAEVSYAASLARVAYDPGSTSSAQLLARIRMLGYDAVPARESLALGRGAEHIFIRFFVSAVVGMWVWWPTLFLLYPRFLRDDFSAGRSVALFNAALSLVALVYGGWPFLQGAWRALRVRRATMDTLVVLGTWTAWLYSLVATLTRSGPAYFESAAMITAIVLLGRWLEALAARDSAATLQALAPPVDEAWLVPAKDALEDARHVPAKELAEGDLVAVRRGERVPVDGTVVSGTSDIDAARLTGEPLPREIGAGDEVWAGALNLTDTIVVRAERVDEATWHARLAALVEDAAFAKSHAQRTADAAASVFVPSVIAVSAATLLITSTTGGGLAEAVQRAVAVLVVACPCALGLATPLAVTRAVSAGAHRGLILRGGRALERAGTIAAVAFDKTGTLTQGEPSLREVLGRLGEPAPAEEAREILAVAAALEARGAHPVARAVCEAASSAGARPAVASAAERIPGRGIGGAVNGAPAFIGSEALLADVGAAVPGPLAAALATARASGALAVLVATAAHADGAPEARGALVFTDAVREEAAAIVAALGGRGVATALVSGDAEATTRAVADAVGIATTHAEVLPHRKEEVVRAIAESGPVAFVGDGVNDAAALSAADLAVTVAGGSDVALAAADVVLATPEDASARSSALLASTPRRPLEALPALIDLAARTRRVVRQNLIWAFSYNLVTVPLAAAGVLTPMAAAAAMALSSLAVVVNSWRLRTAVVTL